MRFTLARGVTFAFGLTLVFTLARLTLIARFALMFAFAFAFLLALSFTLRFLGRLGLFSFADVFTLRFSTGSSGVTCSGVSPSLVARLMSMATVWPVFTTSPARGS